MFKNNVENIKQLNNIVKIINNDSKIIFNQTFKNNINDIFDIDF